jgi:hypothetical protein
MGAAEHYDYGRDAEKTAVVAGNDVGRIATLRDVSIKNGEVSGEVVNNSSDTLRDVVVEIRYSWLWADEYHPGKDDPGRTVYYTAAKEIPPGGSARFEYNPRRRFRCGATALSSST